MKRNVYPILPMTLGNMHRPGVRSLAVACAICHHEAIFSVEPWPDSVPVPTFGPRMVCARCGIIGANARPSYHRNGPAGFTKLLSARAPTPRRRRVGPIGGYVSSHRRMDGLNPVAWRQHHDRGAHVGFDCLVFVNPSGARLQRFTSVALDTQRALCEPVIGPSTINISRIPCKFPALC